MTFFFKITKKDIILKEEDDEGFKKNCRFSEKTIESDKVKDHCHLGGKH